MGNQLIHYPYVPYILIREASGRPPPQRGGNRYMQHPLLGGRTFCHLHKQITSREFSTQQSVRSTATWWRLPHALVIHCPARAPSPTALLTPPTAPSLASIKPDIRLPQAPTSFLPSDTNHASTLAKLTPPPHGYTLSPPNGAAHLPSSKDPFHTGHLC